MPHQHRYNTRSSTARGRLAEHNLHNHKQQHLDNHKQHHLDHHQHDPGFNQSSSSHSSVTREVSSYYDSGQDLLHAYDNQHGRRNNHYEYYSNDKIDTSRNRDRNQSLLPDANAPFGYQLSGTGKSIQLLTPTNYGVSRS